MCWAEVSNIWTSSTQKRKCQEKKNTHNSQNIIIATAPFPQNYDFPRCAHACQKESKCCSYEFSPTYLQCNLNEECKPTQKKHSDFLYCKKIGRLDKDKDLGETDSFASLGDLEARAHIIFVKQYPPKCVSTLKKFHINDSKALFRIPYGQYVFCQIL